MFGVIVKPLCALGTSGRHLVMAWMFLEHNITHILNAKIPASQNSTTPFLKTIFSCDSDLTTSFFGHPVEKSFS